MDTKFGELDFNGVLIQLTQSDNFDMMINATEMWIACGRPANKRPVDWLRISGTIEYLNCLKSEVAKNHFTLKSEWGEKPFTPVLTIKGNYADGTRSGTWLYKPAAIRYAQHLKPIFAVWIDQKIEELLRTGFTTALDEERNKYNTLLQSVQPKIDYYDQVLTYSENLYSTEQLCKDLGFTFGAKKLLQNLENLKYIFRRGKAWYLCSPYDKEGYTKLISKVVIDKKTGRKYVSNSKRWTEYGKHWIWSLRNRF